MNLLAHALLSPPNDPAALFGNLTADWVKGRARQSLHASIRRGMEIHQQIDIFTDLHPAVHQCSNLLEEKWGRYSPILVDVLFDHVLSLEWSHHSTTDRPALIAQAYAALRPTPPPPPRTRPVRRQRPSRRRLALHLRHPRRHRPLPLTHVHPPPNARPRNRTRSRSPRFPIRPTPIPRRLRTILSAVASPHRKRFRQPRRRG